MWLRGDEEARMLEPLQKKVDIMSLFLSNSTAPEGITAEVIVVKSFDELDQVSAQVITISLKCIIFLFVKIFCTTIIFTFVKATQLFSIFELFIISCIKKQ